MMENITQEFSLNNSMLPRRCNRITPVISKDMYLSVSYDKIKKHEDKYEKFLNWDLISSSGKLTEADIIKNADKINWRLLVMYQQLSDYILIKFREKFDWESVFMYQELSYNNRASYRLDEEGNVSQFTHTIKYIDDGFIRKVEDLMSIEAWDALIRYQFVSEETIQRYLSKTLGNKGLLFAGVDPSYYVENVCRYQYLSTDMLDNIITQFVTINYSYLMKIISEKQFLNERQLDEYKDELSWEYITPNLSEDLLIKYKDYVDWGYVSRYSKKYSKEFLSDMSFYLDKYQTEMREAEWKPTIIPL